MLKSATATAWSTLYVVASFAVVLLAWETLTRAFAVPVYILPPPSVIVTELAARWPRVASHASATIIEILVGYLLSVAISIPLALAIVQLRFVYQTVYPLMVFLQIIPKIAIAPLFVIWFGFGYTPRILVVVLLCFFPIAISSIAGFRSVRPEILELAASAGAGKWMQFRKIGLPSALPSLFTGLKVAAALAATAAVVAEFVASDRGLGYLLLEFNGDLNTPMVFGIIVVLSAMGLALYYAVELIERLTIPWHVSQRGLGMMSGI
jgi:NitT/TauT family transport system permease protein